MVIQKIKSDRFAIGECLALRPADASSEVISGRLDGLFDDFGGCRSPAFLFHKHQAPELVAEVVGRWSPWDQLQNIKGTATSTGDLSAIAISEGVQAVTEMIAELVMTGLLSSLDQD